MIIPYETATHSFFHSVSNHVISTCVSLCASVDNNNQKLIDSIHAASLILKLIALSIPLAFSNMIY